jgi:hypothetical protein
MWFPPRYVRWRRVKANVGQTGRIGKPATLENRATPNEPAGNSDVSLRTVNKKPPKGIYFVAIVFFVGGVICMGELLNVIFAAFGIPEGPNLATLKWVLTGYGVALCLVCYGVALLARLHPAAQWLMFGMTLLLTVQAATTSAGDSPFYSAPRIYLNRFLLLLPMIASCVYLRLPHFRAACRKFRGG